MTPLPTIPWKSCRWGGTPEEDGRRRCSSPKLLLADGKVSAPECSGCFLRDHEPTPLVSTPVPTPCVHLGDPTGERVLCQTCRGHVEIKLMACAVFGVCTTHKPLPRIACCQGCPDYAAGESDSKR